MAKVIGRPGSHLANGIEAGESDAFALGWGWVGTVLGCILIAVAAGFFYGRDGFLFGLLMAVGAAVICPYVVWQMMRVWPRANERRGLEGEDTVGRILGKLPDEYIVLHDVVLPTSKGNIDHVVVGPTGIFVVETKNLNGKMTAQGDELLIAGLRPHKDPLKQTLMEAMALKDFLVERLNRRYFVNAILAPTGPLWVDDFKKKSVEIVRPTYLVRRLNGARRNHTLSKAEVDSIALALTDFASRS